MTDISLLIGGLVGTAAGVLGGGLFLGRHGRNPTVEETFRQQGQEHLDQMQVYCNKYVGSSSMQGLRIEQQLEKQLMKNTTFHREMCASMGDFQQSNERRLLTLFNEEGQHLNLIHTNLKSNMYKIRQSLHTKAKNLELVIGQEFQDLKKDLTDSNKGHSQEMELMSQRLAETEKMLKEIRDYTLSQPRAFLTREKIVQAVQTLEGGEKDLDKVFEGFGLGDDKEIFLELVRAVASTVV